MKLSELVVHLQGLLERGDRGVYVSDMVPFGIEDIQLQTENLAEPDKYPMGFVHLGEW